MKTDIIFREIDSLISVVETVQRDLFDSTFDTLKILADEVPYFRLERVQSWVEAKSASLFQFAHAVNRKAEKFSQSYTKSTEPASTGAYLPFGLDMDNV